MEVFLLGFPKSGTSTFHRALNLSGFNSVHWQTRNNKRSDEFVGKLIYESYFSGEDPLKKVINFGYDCVTQSDVCIPNKKINFWPILDYGLLLCIAKYHPECKFIYNYRVPKKIINSINNWGDLRKRITLSDISGLPTGYGNKDSDLLLWINNHYLCCRKLFKNYNNFLVIDIESEDAQLQLSDFLNVKIKWWGIANKNNRPCKILK